MAARPEYFLRARRSAQCPLPTSLKGLHRGTVRESLHCEPSRRREASRFAHPRHAARVRRRFRFASPGLAPSISRSAISRRATARIEFLGRISDEQLAHEYSQAFAVPFVPFDEDLGLVTIEAHMSGKPVITCTDTGGVAELVEHAVTGLVGGSRSPTRWPAAIDELAAQSSAGARTDGHRG